MIRQSAPAGEAARSSCSRLVVVALGGMILLYTLVFGYYQIARYHAFQAEDYDQAMNCQAFWNISHRFMFTESLHGWSYRTHFIPGYMLPAAVYRLGGAPAVFLLETMLIALGAIPLFALARHQRAGPGEALLVAAVYLVYAPLQRILLQNLHPEMTIIPLLLLAFYCLAANRFGWFWLCIGTTWLFKEELLLTGGMFGLYLILVKRRWRAGFVLGTVCAAFFLIIVFWVLPQFGDRHETIGFIYTNPGGQFAWWREAGLAGVVPRALRALTERGGEYALHLLGPLIFLPLCAPEVLMLAAVALLKNLLGLPWLLEPFNYHQSFVIPFLMLGMVMAIPRVCRWFRLGNRGRWLLHGALLSAAVAHNGWYSPLPYSVHMRRQSTAQLPGRNPRAGALAAAVALVPPGVSVMGTENVLDHLADRPELYMLHYTAISEEFVVLDLVYQSEPATLIQALHTLRGRVKAAEYHVVFFRDDVAVLQKNVTNRTPRDAGLTGAFLARTEAILAARGREYFRWSSPEEFYRPRLLQFVRRREYYGPVGPVLNRVPVALGSYSDTPAAVFVRVEYRVVGGPHPGPRVVLADNRQGYLADFPVTIADLREGDNRVLLRAVASDGVEETAVLTLRCDSVAPRVAAIPDNTGNVISLACSDEANPLAVYYSLNDPEFKEQIPLTPLFPRGRLPYDEDITSTDLSGIPYPIAVAELCNRPEYFRVWDLSGESFAPGPQTLYIRAEDLAGNVSATLALPFRANPVVH